jgi:hypothetical protein
MKDRERGEGGEDIQAINLRIVLRKKHLLDTPHIRRAIRIKTARHEPATGVCAGEEVVAASGAVVFASVGDVVDGAVYGEEDGFCGVGAVVEA